MQEFNGIFECDDVDLLRLIYFVEHRRERGGLAAPGSTGNEDDACSFLDNFAKDRRQSELLKRWKL